MPVYVYHCSNCGIQFEKNQKFSDPFLKRCPECGKLTLHKVFTPVSVIYKGSGFYSTDYHSNSGKTSPQAQKKIEDKSDEKKSEVASEVKHETSKVKESTAKKEE